jgi:glycosyltransferase involved in cell wall biosynthesis
MVQKAIREGLKAELWTDQLDGFENIYQAFPIPYRFVTCNISMNPIAVLSRIRAFRKLLRECQPRILHAHQTRASFIPLMAARLENIPVRVYHNHGLPYLGYRGLLRAALSRLERTNLRLSTHSLFVSKSTLAEAVKDGLATGDRSIILGEGSAAGIDLEDFKLSRFSESARLQHRNSMGIPASSFVLAFIGRPVRRKGFHLLLEAWESTRLGASGSVLLVAGCSQRECDQALGRTIAGVRGMGYLSDLAPLYAMCDVVALPSEHEGFPYSLLEGGAAGRALLGTDIPGIRCAIQNGITGILVAPKDKAALVEGILRLEGDAEFRKLAGASGRARVERFFSRDLVLDHLLKFYRSLPGN